MTNTQWLALACFILMTAGCIFYLRGQKAGLSRKTILMFKGGTTLLAACLALYGSLQSQLPAHYLIALGIAVCAAADIILELRFKTGMLVFALGHISYIAAFVVQNGVVPLQLIIYFLMIGMVLLFASQLKNRLQEPLAPFLAYSFIIAAMFSLAIGQPILAAIGATLFVISDGLLFSRFVIKTGNINRFAVISLYYLAQFLLALSTVF